MAKDNFFSQLNVFNQCRKYGISVWQCPQFLFLIMGVIIIGSSLITWLIGNRFIDSPQAVTLIILSITVILFIISFVVTQSFDKLAQVSRMKSEFVSIVSHQLRSPLSNLKWGIDTLMSSDLGEISPKQLEYLTVLRENSTRMSSLISDLLTVSRIETSKLSFEKKPFFLVELVRQIIKEYISFSRAANMEIEFLPQADLYEIIADASQIRQAMENLLDNAIRYSREKGKITIKLEKRPKNFYFEIKDMGVGIPKDDQKYVFQKFFRSQNAVRHQTSGSGLGLYIVKAIIEKSGGKIGFFSQEGKGSTFWFVLPLK